MFQDFSPRQLYKSQQFLAILQTIGGHSKCHLKSLFVTPSPNVTVIFSLGPPLSQSQKVTNSELKFDRHSFIQPEPEFSWTFGFHKCFDNVELSRYTKFQKIDNNYGIQRVYGQETSIMSLNLGRGRDYIAQFVRGSQPPLLQQVPPFKYFE